MTKHVLEIMALFLVSVLLAVMEARPANSFPIQIPSTESGTEALKNSELEARLKQQSGENKNSESIQRTTEDEEEEEGNRTNDDDEDGGNRGQSDGRPMGAPSAEELYAAETENFDPEEEEEEEDEEERWKDDGEDLEQGPVDEYVDEYRREYGEQSENFRSVRNHENESRSETEIQNEAGEHGGDGSEELEEEEEERNEERFAAKGEDTENKEFYKEFDAPLNVYSNERNQADYPLERIKKTMEIKPLTRSDGSSLTGSDNGGGDGDGDRSDVRGYLPASSAM